MVAAKSLVATALIALGFAGLALGDNPTVKIRSADQATAVAALLRASDFGAGWQGGQTAPAPLASASCPDFKPKRSNLVVSGRAAARFTFAQGDIVLDQDVEVLASAAAVREDFARTITPKFASCLAYRLERSGNVVSATVVRIPFPPTGAVSAAYRATVVVYHMRLKRMLLSDAVFFGEGRVEYSFSVIAPLGARNQLGRFEVALAQILLKRAAATQSQA